MDLKEPCWAAIRAIRSYLPKRVLTNEELSPEVGWTAQEIFKKTGIAKRHISAPDECVSDMATAAARRLFSECDVDPSRVQFLVMCTQTPDYILPTTACIVQERLGLPTDCAAFDINLGCSGYIYSLAIASSFVRSGLFERGLILTADTYTKYIHPKDRSVRTLFGDAATATYVTASQEPGLKEFCFGTDGRGADNLIIPAGGTRRPRSPGTANPCTDASGNIRSADNLFMDGSAIFTFTLQRVPQIVQAVLASAQMSIDDMDWIIFHQASKFLMDHLRQKMGLRQDRYCIYLEGVGNTVSSTIPLVMEHEMADGHFIQGQHVLLVGFGVGLSWGAAILRLSAC